MYPAFTDLDTVVVAVAQEDTDLASHARFFRGLAEPFPFEVVADLRREVTLPYDRTTAYLIDKQGIVRQVFPMLIHHRATWNAILGEVQALEVEPGPEGQR